MRKQMKVLLLAFALAMSLAAVRPPSSPRTAAITG